MFDFLYEDSPDDKDLPLSDVIGVRLSRVRQLVDELSDGKAELKLLTRWVIGSSYTPDL
jgi:3'-phosphoadenosine 5'-phosphosulfate sulfotransferase